MFAMISYTMITALRDLLFIGLLAVLLIAMIISTFLGGTAITEQQQMIISYISGSSRVISAIGMIIFVCFHVKRLFDNKEIEFVLSKSISRAKFVISYWVAFLILCLSINIPMIFFVGIFTRPDLNGLIFWGISLLFEQLLIIAFALVSSLILRSSVASVLSTLSFYVLSRMMGFFVSAIKIPFNTNLPNYTNFIDWISQWVLELTSTILPRLDLFAKTKWLIYGIVNYDDIWICVCQSFVYIPLLLSMAIIDFDRKQF